MAVRKGEDKPSFLLLLTTTLPTHPLPNLSSSYSALISQFLSHHIYTSNTTSNLSLTKKNRSSNLIYFCFLCSILLLHAHHVYF